MVNNTLDKGSAGEDDKLSRGLIKSYKCWFMSRLSFNNCFEFDGSAGTMIIDYIIYAMPLR